MRSFCGYVLLCVAFSSAVVSQAEQYDPLKVEDDSVETTGLVVKDAERDREIPFRIYFPSDKEPSPVVLFSHGLGGNRDGSRYLGDHWARRGYVCVFLQHPGSDDSVWKGKPPGQRMAAMNQAAGLDNLRLRIRDVPAVIDQLKVWNSDKDHPLAGRLDLKKLGMSGHSFGAVTTQAVSGQSHPLIRAVADSRIKSAVVMSPSAPRRLDPKQAFGEVKIPWLLLTGTNDVSMIGETDMKSRLAVYPALPAGAKYELVLDQAEHSAFTDRALPGENGKRNPNHHRAILAVTTAFWDSTLRGSAEAREWLEGDSVRKILDAADRWQHK